MKFNIYKMFLIAAVSISINILYYNIVNKNLALGCLIFLGFLAYMAVGA